jgi:tetratricopeptide (TPR) repeat protein
VKRALAVALLAVSTVASAEPAAGELHEQAARAYREARYPEAIELLSRAQRLDPRPELSHDLGRAHEAAGDLVRAIASFRDYLRLEPAASDRAVIEARIANLERKRAELVPRLTIGSSPAGATVLLDGRAVGTTPWSGTAPAGSHGISLRSAGFRAIERRITLVERQQFELSVVLEPVVLEPVPVAPARPAPRKVSLPVFVAFGVGAGALGTAAGFELARASAEDSARGAPTQLDHQQRYAAAERRRDVARVLLGVGAAAILTGGVLLYLDLGSERAPGAVVGVGKRGRF